MKKHRETNGTKAAQRHALSNRAAAIPVVQKFWFWWCYGQCMDQSLGTRQPKVNSSQRLHGHECSSQLDSPSQSCNEG